MCWLNLVNNIAGLLWKQKKIEKYERVMLGVSKFWSQIYDIDYNAMRQQCFN